MVVSENQINNIMGGMQQSSAVRLNNHKHKLRHRFDIVKKLGQGTYGKVQLAINKETGQDVAIKTIKKAKIETEKDLVRIRREIQIMSSVTHPHIIHIFEVFENRDKMVLVMEYAAGGELYDYLSEKKVLSESDARRIFRQVASACYYCHKHKICHRDLKLENILLDEYGNAKIADFGLSNVFDDSRLLSTYCGSPLYASPEIVRGTPYVGPEVDCWSLGVLLYTLVYGAMPFDGSNFKKLVKQITAGDFYEPSKKSPASELIHALLTAAPDRRATMVDVCGHWWVNQGEELPCLEAAEELANQTPVRLDLLLSLAPQGDKEHVLVPLPDEVIAPLVPGKEPTQFGASDSLSLGSAIELDPASSQAVAPTPGQAAPTEQVEPGADKAAKRTLDESEEPAAPAKKTDKAKKRVAEKKKKKPAASSAPAPAPEDVPMKDVAAAGQETEAPATGGRVEPQEVGPAGTGEMEVMPAAEERPPPPAEAAPRPVEAQPTPVRPAEEEKVAPAVDDAGGKEQGGQAVGAQDVPSPAGDVETASRSEGDDEASAPAADVQSEGKSKGDEKSADSEQLIVPPPPSEDVTAKSRSPSADRRSITPSEDKLREAAVREEKTIGASPEADESKDVPKPSEPKPRDAKEAVFDQEKEDRKQDVSISVAEMKKDTDIVPRDLKSPQKESLPSKTEIVVVSEDDEGIADKPKESAELPEHRRKQSSPKHEGEAAASPKKSRIPVKDAKSAESIAKNKVSQATDDVQAPSRLSPAADAKKTVASKSKDKVPAVPKPEKAADVKRDVQPEAKKQTVEQDKDTRTPEKPGDKKTPPQEKPKHKEEKPEEKVKATPAKAEEKTKEKLAKPEEKPSDKLAKPKPSLKMPERRSPARSSADSLPSSIRTAPADERPLPTAPQPAPAAKARLNRVFSDGERQEPPAAPAAPQPERSQSLPPRRAASKEFIIPIRLADGEEMKPASPAPALQAGGAHDVAALAARVVERGRGGACAAVAAARGDPQVAARVHHPDRAGGRRHDDAASAAAVGGRRARRGQRPVPLAPAVRPAPARDVPSQDGVVVGARRQPELGRRGGRRGRPVRDLYGRVAVRLVDGPRQEPVQADGRERLAREALPPAVGPAAAEPVGAAAPAHARPLGRARPGAVAVRQADDVPARLAVRPAGVRQAFVLRVATGGRELGQRQPARRQRHHDRDQNQNQSKENLHAAKK